MAMDRDVADDRRWAARPVLGALLRVAVVVVPVLVGLGVGIWLAHLLPAAQTWPGRIGWYAAVLGGSFAALLLTDRLARRLLPLAVLLELSLLFPDRAPSRLRAARTPSVREIEKKMLALRRDGISSEPIETAETLVTLVGILGVHDKKTRGHSERVRAFTDLLTDELRLDEADRMRLRWAALVHDLGKLVVPGRVLNGGSDLSDDEWETIRRHPHEGQRLAAGLLPWLGEWGAAVVAHHERWDGSGYPAGLAGADIPYGARIVAVADAFEVMTSARSYHRPRSAAAARKELTRCAGAQFDPQVVRAFLGISVGRLRWVLGPVTWLAQLPFAAAADRAGQVAKGAATAAAVGSLVAVGVVPGPGGHPAGPVSSVTAASPAPAGAPVPGPAAPQALPFTEPDPSVPLVLTAPAPSPSAAVEPTSVAPTLGPPAPAPAGPVAPAAEPTAGPVAPALGPVPPTASPEAPSPTPSEAPSPDASPTPSPSPPPVPEPVPPPVVEPPLPPVPAPSASDSPSAGPSPSPSPTEAPTPSPSPSPAPIPAPAVGTFFLGSGGVLRPDSPAGTADTVPLQVGDTASYDVAVPLTTALSGTPRVYVSAFVADREGNAANVNGDGHGRLLVTLWDCTTLSACTQLASGHVDVHNQQSSGPQLEQGDLQDVDAVVEAGHTLRLTVELDHQGNATSVVLVQGGDSGSRLELTQTQTPAAVAGIGLLALLLLGGFAARPKPLQVVEGVDVAG